MKSLNLINEKNKQLVVDQFILSVYFAFASVGISLKLGWFVTILYVVFVFYAWWSFPNVLSWAKKVINETQCLWIGIVVLVSLAIISTFVHPLIDKNGFQIGRLEVGPSDSDNGLYDTTSSLLRGEYPYYSVSFLGNKHTPMPGSILIAIPFVLINKIVLQNIFWLCAFLFVLWKYIFKDIHATAITLLYLVIVSPNTLYHLMTGIDYVSNSIYIIIFTKLLLLEIKKINNINREMLNVYLLAALSGVTFSSRLNFIFLIPLIFGFSLKEVGFLTSVKIISVLFFSFFAITFPFYIYDIEGFSPLHTANKIRFSLFGFEHWNIVILFITAFLSAGLGLLRSKMFFSNCLIAVSFPIFSSTVLSLATMGMNGVSYFHYGVFLIFFVILSVTEHRNSLFNFESLKDMVPKKV